MEGLPKWLNIKVISAIGLFFLLIVIVSMFAKARAPMQGFQGPEKSNVVLDTSNKTMFPYATDPIASLDQYEIDAVFENEGDRELKKQQVNQMTRRYPLDWVNYPPNSSKFQSEQAKYIEGFSTNSSAKELSEPYKNIGDGNLTPPDTAAMEREEKEILATYAPRKSGDKKTYDTYDAQKLLEQIYKPKGLKPTVSKHEDNVFEVISTRSLKDKVEYEDDLPEASTTSTSNLGPGEATIEVPPTAVEIAAGRDPFYEPTTSTRSSRTDYMRWTPGLERMFAPTHPISDWVGKSGGQ